MTYKNKCKTLINITILSITIVLSNICNLFVSNNIVNANNLKEETYTVPPFPFKAVTGDFNKDSHKDIAVVSKYSGITVFLNNGKGKFSETISLVTHWQPVSITKGDFNKDNLIDIISMTETLIGPVYITNKDSAFEKIDLKIQGHPFAFYIEAVDLNNDGYDDLVTSGVGGEGLYIFINKGNLTFEKIIIKLRETNHVYKFNKKGDTEFISHHPYIIDIDNDGWKDILVPDEINGSLWLLKNNKGKLVPNEIYHEDLKTIKSVTSAKIKNELTLIVAIDENNKSELLFLQNRKSKFEIIKRLTFPQKIEYLDTSDMNNDRNEEIIILSLKLNNSYVSIYNIESESINISKIFEYPLKGTQSFSIDDLDEEGYKDLIIPDTADNTLRIIYNPLKR